MWNCLNMLTPQTCPLSTILLRFRHISALCTSHRDHRASLLVFPSFTRTTYRSAIPNTHNSPTSTRITLAPPAFQHMWRCHKKGEVSIAVGCSLHQNPMVNVMTVPIEIATPKFCTTPIFGSMAHLSSTPRPPKIFFVDFWVESRAHNL